MTINVLIPTYNRTRDLGLCLEAQRAQLRGLDEVLIVVRDTDSGIPDLLARPEYGALPLRQTVEVTEPSSGNARNAGLAS